MNTTQQTPAAPDRLQVDVHFVDLEILTMALDALLGELQAEAPAPAECCSPEEQRTCCDPEDKAECCDAAAAGGPCGCR